MFGPKGEPERDRIVGWWDEDEQGRRVNQGRSQPLTEEEAQQVKEGHIYSSESRHAIILPRPRR